MEYIRDDIHPDKQRLAASIAMTVLLISFSMLFAALFLGYTVYRVQAEAWPPMGMSRISLFYPLVSTFFILLSSFTYWRFENSFFEKAQAKVMNTWLWATIVLGVGFFVSQWMVWKALWAEGLYVEAGIFPSLIHGFTWIHLAHMALGLILLFILAWRVPRTSFSLSDENKVVSFGKFWHFLDIIWIVMFVVLFVL